MKESNVIQRCTFNGYLSTFLIGKILQYYLMSKEVFLNLTFSALKLTFLKDSYGKYLNKDTSIGTYRESLKTALSIGHFTTGEHIESLVKRNMATRKDLRNK